MFAWTERELNEEQGAAVVQPGSVFLVACPGSGKTRTLTYKIARELSLLTSSRQYVVAITYTNRAADEIVARIEALGVDTRQLWIGTIHAFCLEWVLKPYSIYLPRLARGFTVIDPYDRQQLLERLCAAHERPRITHYDCDYFVTSTGTELCCRENAKRVAIRAVLRQYFQALRDSQQIDFEMILGFADRLLRAHPAISRTLSHVFSMILVDEYQDTKQVQYEIIGSILRAGSGRCRLFMVGDPNQAIYGSLGGYAIAIEDLRALTGIPIAQSALSRNYRSSRRIIEYFEHFNLHSTQIEAFGRDREFESRITYNAEVTRADLVVEIGRLVRHAVHDLAVPQREVCVLAPQWVHLAALTRRLVTEVPEIEFDGPGMAPFSRNIENFWYTVACLALTEPSPSMYLRRVRWATKFLSALNDAGVALNHVDQKAVLKHCNSIRLLQRDGLDYLRAFFDSLFERMGVDFHVYLQLLSDHDAFFSSSHAQVERLEGEGVRDSRDLTFFKRVFAPRSGITVSTIHGVKGGEFDVVIACGLLEGMVPHFSDPEGESAGRKLLYVTASRARKHLHLISEKGRRRGNFGDYSATEVLERYRFNYNN
ncbi:UvrD-helicase domain-containing protein [Caballeronia novacaledonica]|uniref:DNA 3'-5' helicase n=1 Tax=Caballeronia novacaledonica TaxID=1544861 RepID=A0AA37MVM8_9BURK|nr:ATP-dependent helicase [Caballeronia novacaledonica]GJH30914.1 ATP-dependent helicase [Caballeronia novacaledonica]